MHSAVRLLSTREHSRYELERKLLRHYADEVVHQVLDELKRQGLQSDDRFTESYVHSRRNKGYGPLRIRAELSGKGVAEELIAAWLDESPDDWDKLMRRVANKKYGSDPPVDRKEMAKRGRFLASRGFPSWLINDYLFG